MCKCTPEIRTPFCGKQGCELPKQIQYVAIRNGEAVNIFSKEQALSYSDQGYVILRWKPLTVARDIIVIE